MAEGQDPISQWTHRRGPQTSAFIMVIEANGRCLGLVMHYPTSEADDWAYNVESAKAGFKP